MKSFFNSSQRQLDILYNPLNSPRNRIKACLFVIKEADKAEDESKKRLNKALTKESITMFNICVSGLNFLSDCPLINDIYTKQNFLLVSEIEEILEMLQTVVKGLSIIQTRDIEHDSLYKILYNLICEDVAVKYKIYGLLILLNYIQKLDKAKLQITQVNIKRIVRDWFYY